jgi:8-oxo-dGTP pyrophosphatase MutT (NUDIX family)
MKYRKGVFIVVYRTARRKRLYLVLHRKLHWIGWEFPKGGMKHESILHGVKRELKEETGCSALRIIRYSGHGKYKYDKKLADRRNLLGQTYDLFSAEIDCRKIRLDKKEHSGYRWLKFKQALKILTWPNQKKCLKIVERVLR